MKVKAIFGPPGTGKTRRLVDIAHREAEERQARGVLYLSYTRAAAEEAVSRVQDDRIRPSTLHSYAFNAQAMTRSGTVDRKKLAEFGKEAGIPFQGSEKGSDEPQEGDEYATVLQYANNRIIQPIEAWDMFGRPGTETRFKNFVEAYQAWKRTYGYKDFDDMLADFNKSQIMTRQAEVVILDEAQDCTPLQWLTFIKIAEMAKRVYIAGDDDQAIYEWSGANPHGMVEFAEEHDGIVEVLDQSWRVPRKPYDLAMQVVEEISKRKEKLFSPKKEQGSVTRYGDLVNIDFRALAKKGAMILGRDRFTLDGVKKTLQQQMIPYDMLGGGSPWTSKIAQDIRDGKKPDIPPWWREFYKQADLNQPINLTVSTVHQAKGREHKTVVVDLSCPTRVLLNYGKDPDSEHRVWYVAVTRTAGDLILCGENPVLP